MITKPNLTDMSDARLAEYVEFCAAQMNDYSPSMTRVGRTGWRREFNRVTKFILERERNR